MLAAVEVLVPTKQKTLRQIRLGLGMSLRELQASSKTILGRRVHYNVILRAEHGEPITELTATRLLLTINALYTIRGRPTLTLDDITWNIRDRKIEDTS